MELSLKVGRLPVLLGKHGGSLHAFHGSLHRRVLACISWVLASAGPCMHFMGPCIGGSLHAFHGSLHRRVLACISWVLASAGPCMHFMGPCIGGSVHAFHGSWHRRVLACISWVLASAGPCMHFMGPCIGGSLHAFHGSLHRRVFACISWVLASAGPCMHFMGPFIGGSLHARMSAWRLILVCDVIHTCVWCYILGCDVTYLCVMLHTWVWCYILVCDVRVTDQDVKWWRQRCWWLPSFMMSNLWVSELLVLACRWLQPPTVCNYTFSSVIWHRNKLNSNWNFGCWISESWETNCIYSTHQHSEN